jgi:hypothetical protein
MPELSTTALQHYSTVTVMDKRSPEGEMIPVISYCMYSVHLRVMEHADAFPSPSPNFHSRLTSFVACILNTVVLQLERLAGSCAP